MTSYTDFVIFLEDGIRYEAVIFSVHLYFNKLSNDISHVVLAQNFIISTCLKSVEKHETVIESVNYLCKHTIIKHEYIQLYMYIYLVYIQLYE